MTESDIICFFWFMFSTWYRFCLLVCLLLLMFVCFIQVGKSEPYWSVHEYLVSYKTMQTTQIAVTWFVSEHPRQIPDKRNWYQNPQLRVDLNKSIFWATSPSKYIFIATVFTFLSRNDADSCETISSFLVYDYQVTMDCCTCVCVCACVRVCVRAFKLLV